MSGFAPPQARRIRVNDVTLAIQISGCGSPIVLVHGSLDDHRSGQQVIPYLFTGLIRHCARQATSGLPRL